MLTTILRRDITLAFRRGGGAIMGLAFFSAVFALFAFGLGPEALKQYAQPVLAAALLLSVQLFLPQSLERDAEDGTLEHFLLMPVALEWLIFTRMLAAWVAHAVPLLIASPILLMMADSGHIAQNMTALLLASITLTSIGYMSACLLLTQHKHSALHVLITLPFSLGPLIFTASPEQGGALALLAVSALISLPLCCWLSALLMRMSVE